MAETDRAKMDSEESENLKGSSSGEDDGHENSSDGHAPEGISEYEKQRLSRMAENKARMEALGLSKMASSLMGSARALHKRKGKQKVAEDDDDYKPNADEFEEDDNEEYDEYDEDLTGKSSSRSGKKKVKSKDSRLKRKALSMKTISDSDCVDDDEDLRKAIALSLQNPVGTPGTENYKAGNGGKMKKKNEFTSRVQMTEDEMILYFYQFDEAGKGWIALRDLRKMVEAHDFTWNDEEMVDMIRCFDSDRDGKLGFDDFRKIVERCRMLKQPGGD